MPFVLIEYFRTVIIFLYLVVFCFPINTFKKKITNAEFLSAPQVGQVFTPLEKTQIEFG